jgi:hypothetical protein
MISISNGSGNNVSVDQAGSNSAEISIVGGNNALYASQFGLGNMLDIGIVGNNNNNPLLGGFSGEAALASPSLQPGQIIQSGISNMIRYNVGSGLPSSDSNRFAFSQDGNGNEIFGETIGSHNQVVVVQNGNSNLTSFIQIGNGNIIGVTQ